MTNVTILQNNKMQNIFAVFLARQGGWQTYEMCSILPDCKRWAQFDAYIQYIHYTYHYYLCNICIYDIYVTYTFCNYLDKENLPGELEAIVKLELHQSRTETCFWRYFFANNFCFWRYLWWFQNACAIFTIPPPLCSGRPISPTFLVLVICMSIASQSINRADTRPHLTTPD